jgi:signal transduction histidine kinase
MYKDDGTGFGKKNDRKGLGMRSIEYRLNILNGKMELDSENGLFVKIQIPVVI